MRPRTSKMVTYLLPENWETNNKEKLVFSFENCYYQFGFCRTFTQGVVQTTPFRRSLVYDASIVHIQSYNIHINACLND